MVNDELRYFLCEKGGEVDRKVNAKAMCCIWDSNRITCSHFATRRNLYRISRWYFAAHNSIIFFKLDTGHACEIKSAVLQTPVTFTNV